MTGYDRPPSAREDATAAGAPRRGRVVVIAAAELETLRTLLGALPGDAGASFVIVYCAPTDGRGLVDLLQPHTEMPIRAADGALLLAPNTILVVPAQGDDVDSPEHVPPSIHRVFRAIAAARGEEAVGVLLAGAGVGSEGVLGLAAIQGEGGLTVVQDPSEAADGGPRAAIEAGVADLVLPLRDIAVAVARFSGAEPRSPPTSGAGQELRVLPDARVVHLALLERYTPASVLVDAAGRVLHYTARAARYLSLRGEATDELVRLVRQPLRSAVRAGLEALERRAITWTSDALLVHADNGVRRVAVHVDSAGPGFPAANVKLVVFEEVELGDTVNGDGRPLTTVEYTARLESELDEATRRLRGVVGGAGRDVRHGGELKRVLDELETAREELRNVNEELMTLDQDNRTRLEELARLSADLEVLLESTGLATLFLDRDLKIVRFTSPLLDILEVPPADEGRPLADLEHHLRDRDLLGDARRVLEHSAPVEHEVEADNGKWYLLRMLPYRFAPHGVGGVAITLVDITSRRKAEQEIREAHRRKDEFIALLAHELRNPLAPISSGIEILRRRGFDPAMTERITSTMARQASQLVRLIDDLLDVSRINSGRLQLRKERVTLADIVRDAVAAVKPLIERSAHELTIDMPREPIVLDADAARLTQVLANLLNNAARYTPNGGKIALGVRREGRVGVVTVRDTGYGIPANTLPHVFEMFYQGADRRSATQAGLGIGLALAKALVDMHGGTIDAASEGLDRGSEFTVRLPALEQVAAEWSDGRDRSAAALGGHRVLVVDDNADAARTLAVLIETLGENDVHVALSGQEALPLAERIKPDTVFLDLKMPDMDGYEVAQRLRREPWGGDAWLVALTGWGLDEHKRRTKEAGFDQHLTKPADRAALEAILSRPRHAAGPNHH